MERIYTLLLLTKVKVEVIKCYATLLKCVNMIKLETSAAAAGRAAAAVAASLIDCLKV